MTENDVDDVIASVHEVVDDMVLSRTKIRIGSRTLGDGEPAFIIAEAGLNHDGKLSQAKRLIQSAAEAGADAIKFQIYTTEELYSSDGALCTIQVTGI